MGIFDRIKDAIWGRAEAAETATDPATPAGSPPAPTGAPAGAPPPAAPAGAPPTGTPSPAPAPAAAPPAPAPASAGPVDVASVLDEAVRKSGQSLNWKTSIVDLMKALGLDSSLSNRKELAQELGYTGDMDDSATMNVWLHKQVIQKLKDNGGKVPADIA